MGRKIPGRKHRGVKDPEKQQEQRLAGIKDKINAPPNNPDEQQIPKSLSRIIELKDKVKKGLYIKKHRRKQRVDIEKLPESRFKPDKLIPKFEQRPGETDREFLNRVNRVCFNVAKEAKFEDKYGVDIMKNEDGEVINVVKRPKDELEILIKKAKKEQKTVKGKKKKKKVVEPTERLTKSQKWQRKKQEKKKRKQELKSSDFEKYSDHVKFGETVHAPPTLVVPKKSKPSEGATRPARKELLLKSLLNKDDKINKSVEKQLSKPTKKLGIAKKVIDKKGKRKDLPYALRRQLDKQQKQIIEAYKVLKSKKYTK